MAQNIVRLDLSISQTDMALFSFESFMEIALPNLQELVTGNGKCFRFLSFLVIPSSCMITLSFTQRDADSAPSNDPLLWVEQYLCRWQAREPLIHSWYLSSTEDGALALHAGTKDDPPDCPQFVLEYNGAEDTAEIRLFYLLKVLREGVLRESSAMTLDLQSRRYSTVLARKLAELFSQCAILETITLSGRSIENTLLSVFIKYPEAMANLRHLIIDGPYPASASSIGRVKDLMQHVQFLESMGRKLHKISVCVDDLGKYECFNQGVADLAEVVDYLPLRPRVVRRGELTPRGCWSLGP